MTGPPAYYRPGGLISSPSVSPGNIAHEALHNLGRTDGQLQISFFGKEDPYDTTNITQALKDNGCVPK